MPNPPKPIVAKVATAQALSGTSTAQTPIQAHPPAQTTPPVSTQKAFLSPLKILVFSLGFFLAAVLLCLVLAFEWIPGYPRTAQKNVSIYYQSAPASSGLAVYLHPPLNSIQAEGQSQFLGFEFTNRSASPIAIDSIKLLSADCFQMDPQIAPANPSSALGSVKPTVNISPVPLFTLDPNQASLLWYRLHAVEQPDACPGQSPLIFLYTWQQTSTAASIKTPVEQDSISTGPVRLVTTRGLHWQRFFSLLGKTIPVILLPVLLAAGNYLLQDLQSRKADEQKQKDDARESEERQHQAGLAVLQKLQEQKLEVWKIMIPSLVGAIRDHYVPIVRILAILEGEADLPPGKADLNMILACIFLFRTKITHLVDQNGGFYFRNHRAEHLSGTLTNTLLARSYKLSGDRLMFLESTEKLQPVNSITQVRQTLRLDTPPPGRFAQFCAFFLQQLAQPNLLTELRIHARFLGAVLEHEINDPFFPLWYETKQDPLDFKELRGYVKGLNLSAEDEADLSKQLEAYLATKSVVP